jgi:hypothetical protein
MIVGHVESLMRHNATPKITSTINAGGHAILT